MGIYRLNKLIRNKCKLTNVTMQSLSGKTIVIDVMIYMYKYLAEEALLENMYLFCTMLKQFKITPIFIFDGRKPLEKREELDRRREKRKEAWIKYDKLMEKVNNDELNKDEIESTLKSLKRQCVKIKNCHIEDVQNLITHYGYKYLTAEGEADKLCAEFVIHKKAYACMSDDMDLLVYGCHKVLRIFNLSKKNAIMYDLYDILYDLNMRFNDFQTMCILCGTDYNIQDKNNIFEIYKYHEEYKKLEMVEIDLDDFMMYKKYFTIEQIERVVKIKNMFCVNNCINCKYKLFKFQGIDKRKLYKLLEKEYFLNPLTCIPVNVY